MNSFGILQALVFEPKKAFAELDARPRFLLPLLLILIGMAGIAYWFDQVADLSWLADRELHASAFATSRLTAAEIDAQAKAAGAHPHIAGAIAAIGTALVVVIAYLVMSLYYLLAGKITNVQRSFKHWLSLSCWTSLPSLLTMIVSAYVLLTVTNPQIDRGELKLLSLNSLFFHRGMGESGYALLSEVGLPELISMFLVVLGVRVWSARSWIFSAVFALLPTALIYGITAYFTMGRS